MPERRCAAPADGGALFALTSAFATSFRPEPASFDRAFRELVEREDALLLVAADGDGPFGYVLGFDHWTLFANGRVAWIEELFVAEARRGAGWGAALVGDFERWASDRGSSLVALATRRASPFYESLGYDASATYFRKLLPPSVP